MTENPYKGIKIRSDLMEESGKLLLLSEVLSSRYKTIEKYFKILFGEEPGDLKDYLTDRAIDQVNDSIGMVSKLDNKSVSMNLRIAFESGEGAKHCFCVPSNSSNYYVNIKVNASDIDELDCIQTFKFNSTGKISSVKTFKLCTKN